MCPGSSLGLDPEAVMKFKVLVIDDEETLCEIIKFSLEQTGDFNVGFATDGKTGLLMARKGSPDVILLDICMPRMSGFEVLKILKKDYPLSEIPVIVFSGLGDEATMTECNYQYSEEFIEKPVDLAQLKERIAAVLRRVGKRLPRSAPAVV